MRPSVATRLLGARLTWVVLLLAALVPTFSRLMQPVGFAEWTALCGPATTSAAIDGTRPGTPPGSTSDEHSPGDACVLCTLAHTTPTLGGIGLPPPAVVAYSPPAPRIFVAVRMRAVQARAPSARAPPSLV